MFDVSTPASTRYFTTASPTVHIDASVIATTGSPERAIMAAALIMRPPGIAPTGWPSPLNITSSAHSPMQNIFLILLFTLYFLLARSACASLVRAQFFAPPRLARHYFTFYFYVAKQAK
jgi:hypothetical protein